MIFWSFQGVQKETSGLKWVTEKESNWFLTCFNKLHKKLFIFKKLSVLSTISTNLSQILYRYSKPSYWCNYYSQFTHTCYNYMASRSTTSCQVPVNIKGKSRWTNYHLRYHQWGAKVWVYKHQIWHYLYCHSEGGSSKWWSRQLEYTRNNSDA